MTPSLASVGEAEELGEVRDLLQASEARRAAMLQLTVAGVVSLDDGGRILEVNQAALAIFGREARELHDQTLSELLIAPASREKLERGLHSLGSGVGVARTAQLALTAIRHDGTEFPIEVALARVRAPQPGYVALLRDLSERKRVEASMREVEERYAMLVERLPAIVYIDALDDISTGIYISPQIERILGWPAEEWLTNPRSWVESVHTEDRERALAELAAGRQSGKPFTSEYRLLSRDGRVVWIRDDAVVAHDEDGGPRYLLGAMFDITESKRAERALLEARERWSALVERLPAVVYLDWYDEMAGSEYISPRVEAILGWSAEELMAEKDWWTPRVHPDDRERAVAEWDMQRNSTEPVTSIYRMIARDGRAVWFNDVGVQTYGEDGKHTYMLGVMFDISEHKRIEDELHVRAQQQEAIALLGQRALDLEVGRLFEEAVIVAAHRLGVEFVSVFEAMEEDELLLVAGVGWRAGQVGQVRVHGGTRSQAGFALRQGDHVVSEDLEGETRFRPNDSLLDQGAVSGSTVIIGGRERPFGALQVSTKTPRKFSLDDLNFLQAVANVLASAIERRKADEHIRHQALHDALTGLPNRRLFMDRLTSAMDRTRRHPSRLAVLFLDLDRFKTVNDSLGHEAGDQLLVTTAQRLRGAVRMGDTVARFGGDEFVILCEDLAGKVQIDDIAGRLTSAVEEPVMLGEREVTVTPSLGVAIASSGLGPDALISEADSAMYRAKQRGGARYEVYDEKMRASSLERLELETDLRRALHSRELRIHYQPEFSLHDGGILGFEALVRWQHPERGLLEASEFIDLAEETGIVATLGAWVIAEASEQAKRWQGIAGRPVPVAVNVSARQITQPELVETVLAALRSSRLDPELLYIEVPEAAVMADAAPALETMARLKELGVHLTIDDFGAGFSSLAALKRLSMMSVLKADRSLIQGLGISPEARSTVQAAMALARGLELRFVAKGLETDGQLAELNALGCEAAQGFHLGRPQTAEAISVLLEAAREFAKQGA